MGPRKCRRRKRSASAKGAGRFPFSGPHSLPDRHRRRHERRTRNRRQSYPHDERPGRSQTSRHAATRGRNRIFTRTSRLHPIRVGAEHRGGKKPEDRRKVGEARLIYGLHQDRNDGRSQKCLPHCTIGDAPCKFFLPQSSVAGFVSVPSRLLAANKPAPKGYCTVRLVYQTVKITSPPVPSSVTTSSVNTM
jgi:hypothetical protein